MSVGNAFPGLPARLLVYLLDDQLAALNRIQSAGERLYLIEASFNPRGISAQAGVFTSALSRVGRPMATLGCGVTDKGRPRFLFLLAASGHLEDLAEKLSAFSVSIRDAGSSDMHPPLPTGITAPRESTGEDRHEAIVPPDHQFEESFDQHLLQLRQMYMTGFPEKVERLNIRLSELKADKSSGPAIEEIYRIGHSIKGSGAIYGFLALSDLGEAMEEALDPVLLAERAVPDSFCPLCAAWIASLIDVIDSAAGGVEKSAVDYDVYHRLKELKKGPGS